MQITITVKDILEGLGYELREWDFDKQELNDDAGFDLVNTHTDTAVWSVRTSFESKAWEELTKQMAPLMDKFLQANLSTDPLIL